MIYLIKRKEPASYDECVGFVIRAKTEKEARKMASGRSGDEGSKIWLDEEKTACMVIDPSGPSDIMLRSYRAG